MEDKNKMNMIDKYQHQQKPQEITYLEAKPVSDGESAANLTAPMLRRWYVVLITALVICSIGIPTVWLTVKPAYAATAAIRIAPIIPSILFSDRDSEGVIPMYRNFVNTQADLITSDKVLQRVADELTDKDLSIFATPTGPVQSLKKKLIGQSNSDIVAALRASLQNASLAVKPYRNTELIKITMQSSNLNDSVDVVNAFVNAYMAMVRLDETEGGDQKLTILENERRALAKKLERQRETLREMAEEYGSTVLTDRQEIMLHRVASLQDELTKIQTRKITLEAKQHMLSGVSNSAISLEKLIKMRYDFINSSPTVQVLVNNITQLEQSLIVAKQILAPTNPELGRKEKLLEALTERLDEKRNELNNTFDEITTKQLEQNHEDRLANIKAELDQLTTYEQKLQIVLDAENKQTITLGRKHLAIQDQQEQLVLTKELHSTIRKRIQELEMERKRPARISVAYYANISPLPNKRVKFSFALVFASLAGGVFLALLMGRSDHSLYTTEDITRRIGVRIIGTTANADYPDILALPQQIAVDYQTIRANLSLLDGGKTPKILVITSAGIRDGKTTFAINLATSLAQTNKKILLVDGDLRKPDIRRLLRLPKNTAGIKELLDGKYFKNVIQTVPSAGFDALIAHSHHSSQAFEMLSRPAMKETIDSIAESYDHIVIDTPPILAFPDALLWAKIADGVILTSFAGHTNTEDLKETLDRLEQIKANVLGTILNNVSTRDSYNRYTYGYYTNQHKEKKTHRRDENLMLLLPHNKKGKNSEKNNS